MRYLIVSINGLFYKGDSEWSEEYPNAKLYATANKAYAARRNDLDGRVKACVWSEEDYATGSQST